MPLPNKKIYHRKRFWLALAAMLGLFYAGILWGFGLRDYIDQIQNFPVNPDAKTDVIVVLTGGADRLQEGQNLLLRGAADKLFITGVGDLVKNTSDLGLKWPPYFDPDCCVELGYRATDTYGNAVETAHWMEQHQFQSMRLVTAAYHMPRSLMEFQKSMPRVTIIPHPVFPAHVKIWDCGAARGSCLLVIGEYNKYLIAQMAHIAIDSFLPGSNQIQ